MSKATGFAEPFGCAAELHQLLVARARATDPGNPGEVINLAVAVVIHGLLERDAVLAKARFVSAELRDGLEGEHASLRDALGLMVELARDPADADDLRVLCAAVHDRILRHVERDDRVIYGSLARLDAFSIAEAD